MSGMRTVNNRYLIDEEISNEENYCKYTVRDCESYDRFILIILKNDFTYEKTQEYLLNKFKTIKNLNCSNVINLLEFQIIYNIDGIKLDKYQYGYLMEYIDVPVSVQEYIGVCTTKEKIDIFMELCAVINTLNIKGYIFKDITWKDIVLFYDKTKNVHLKIDNILQNEISKVSLINVSRNEKPYPYNIENVDESTILKDNISEIIQFLDKMFTDEELYGELKELSDIKKRFNQVHTINKSYNLNYFIKCVNNALGKKYDYFLKNTLNIIEDNIDIIGREEEIKIIEKNYKNILESKIKYKVIGFNGDTGSGKTRLLNEIKYILENKYFKNITYIDNFISKSKNETYKNILGYIKNKCDRALYDKYDIYIKKFISTCLEGDYDNVLNYDNNQQFQLINRVGKFIREYTNSNPLVLLIDDLDKKNKGLKELVRYLSFMGNSLENIMIVFSLNENSCDDEFLEYLNELKMVEQYEEYKINFFNQYDTTKMIKNILNTNKSLGKLSNKIYSETLGNPQYIREVIEELYSNDILYFDEESSKWRTHVNIREILIPKTLEKKLETSLSSLNEHEIGILKLLSIYETPLSEKIIFKIINNIKQIRIYNTLKNKGYFIDKISDQGLLVGFSNNLLRNILYLKLDKEKKRCMHKDAANLLKETLHSTDYYMEEFLFHLEECFDFETLCIYALKYAEKLKSCANYEKALSYYKKVLKYSKSDRIEAAIRIAKIHEKLSNHKKSFEYYEKAKKIAIEEKNINIKSYVMLEMVIIQINSSININSDIEKTLIDIRISLDNINSPKEEAYYNYALSLKYRAQFNYKMAIESAKKALNICENNEINGDIYAWSMVTLATIYIKYSMYNEAKELFLKALEVFAKNKNNNGIIISRIMSTYIDSEEGKPYKSILEEYHDIERLSNKLKLYKRTILTLIYISKFYISQDKYQEAEECLLKALAIEREEGIDFYSLNICTNLCIVYLNIGKLKLAVKYYSLVKQMQKVVPLLEEDIISINSTNTFYNMFIHNNIKAYEYLNEEFNFNKITRCVYYMLKLYICNNDGEIRKTYKELLEKINGLNNNNRKLKIRVSSIKTILDLGYYETAKEFFYEMNEYPKDYNTEGIYVYLEFKFKNRNSYNFLINKALRLCTVINDKRICADLYGVIAEKYEELSCNVFALNNYYESIGLHIDIINILNEEDKIIYANNSRFLDVRKKLIFCLREKMNYKMVYSNIEKINYIEELNLIIDEISIKNTLSDRNMYKLMQKTYEKCYYNDFSSSYDLFNSFTSDILENMENVMKHMARITLADKAILVIENSNGENNIICTYRLSDKKETDRYFSLKLESEEDVIVVSNNHNRLDHLNDEVLKHGIKSCIYMKLRNKDKSINSESSVNGQLILIATNAVNYINSESKKKIEKFKPFLTFLLEKYKLTISSTLDKLTSVYNRKYFEESLVYLLEKSSFNNSEFAVIMFDIDDFKGVNDKYGHQVGDEVLIKLTKEVKRSIGRSDIIGRYGGEEFVVLLPSVDKLKAINMAEKIRNNVEDARILGDKRKVTISIGIAMSGHERINSEEIVNRADQALYMAKHEGKNRYVLWDGEKIISKNTNTNNELSGILSGNSAKDYNFISIIKDVAVIVKSKNSKENKMYEFVLKIMQIIECDSVTLFIIDNNTIINIMSKDRLKDGWNISEKFNFKLVYQTIENKKGMYKVDWDNIGKQDKYGIPDWKSVCIVPVVCNEEVIALIYLSVSVNKKEFTVIDLNKLNFFADMGIPIFE